LRGIDKFLAKDTTIDMVFDLDNDGVVNVLYARII
jgi:hypothetical protein